MNYIEEDCLAVKTQSETHRENQSTEVLFIELDYKFLTEGGILAIVVSDGILTNSSLQYVRNQIAEWFRIIAVVSMPQTAFTTTGAGVKSSVLFLKKWDKKITAKIQNQKKEIQQRIKKNNDYLNTYNKWEQEKKDKQKQKTEELKHSLNLTSVTEVKKTEEYKQWNEELKNEYSEKLSTFYGYSGTNRI